MDADISYLLKLDVETVPIDGHLTLGRHIDNDVIIAGEDVLDFHLRIEPGERGPMIVPLGNATYALNGREIDASRGVIPGDTLGIGPVSIQIGVEREHADAIDAWVLVDEDTERVHDVAADLLVGRHPECGLQLEHEHVSRRHARLVRVAGGLWIQDLGSANGTHVNGRTVSGGCRLFHGDEIRFDEIGFRVRGIGDGLTAVRPFREEDLKPLRLPADTSGPPSAEQSRSLSASIQASLSRRIDRDGERGVERDRSVSASFPPAGPAAAAVTAAPFAESHAAMKLPTLESLLAHDRGRRYALAIGRNRIGSGASCDVRVEFAGLADIHAEIVLRSDQNSLIAVGGAGRVFLNQQPVQVHDLAEGDRIGFGDAEFIFHEADVSKVAGAAAGTDRSRLWLMIGGVLTLVSLLYSIS